MSSTWSLVCHDTKQTIWIGQGNGQMSNFYYGEPATMERLKRFFQVTAGKPLVLLIDEVVHDLDDYTEFKPTRGPFYVWVDASCDNVTPDLVEARRWRDGFIADGRDDVYIVDVDNVIVQDHYEED